MKIHIPNSAFLGNLNHFLRGFDPSDPEVLEVTANESWMSVHPVVLSMIAALGLNVKAGSIKCGRFIPKSKNYIIRMGLLQFLRLDPGDHVVIEHEPAGRFIPLTLVKNSEQSTKLITDMIPLLHLQNMPDQAQALSYTVSELVRNVIEHSKSEHGAVICAQYYKKRNAIGIGIVDTGVGIKKTINQSHAALTDMDAIRLALQPGITGTTKRVGGTSENAGAGLFFIKSIASVNRDFFVIYSGNTLYKLLRKPSGRTSLYADPFEDKHSKDDTFPYWRGTVVGIDITLDQTREFADLLKFIRDTYGKEMRDRFKARYKKPRFTT